VIINAGGGIHQHPSGTACGARAFMDAIEGLCGGENLEIVARRSPSLREALAAWT
jgi:2,3-diketo-5-methylthiopentyl-1-phosphate enolase